MKVLLTGATGFIGSNLNRYLADNKIEVLPVIRPSSEFSKPKGQKVFVFKNNINELIRFIRTNKPDGCIHLASYYKKSHEPADIGQLINSNVLFSTSVLEACTHSEMKWFINTGTFWQHYENLDYSPVNLYAATKEAFERIAEYYFQVSGIKIVHIKLNDTYGPGDSRKKIINLWYGMAKTGESLDMSAGEQLVDMVYIDDVIAAYYKLIQYLREHAPGIENGKSFAIKADKRISLKEMASVFEKTTGYKLNINWGKLPYRNREVMVPWEGGETVPGWKPRITLQEGIRRMMMPD